MQVALTEKASLIASVGGSQPGDDATSDMSDYETSIRKAPTVRARRDRDFLSSVGKERKDDQIRTLENQVEVLLNFLSFTIEYIPNCKFVEIL